MHGHIRATVDGQQRRGGLEAIATVLQAFRARGEVLYLDGGDLLQGTMASNFTGGRATIDGYNALRPAAVALGNHEFDYDGADRARPTLGARMREARFPFLACNVRERRTGQFASSLGLRPSVLVTVGSMRVGIVGAATTLTPITTFPGNVEDLEFQPALECVIREAARLRAQGAEAIVLLAHFGGRCPAGDATPGCVPDGELFELVRALPRGTVDAVAGGHTHQAFSLDVAGLPLIEPAVNGERLGWISLCREGARIVTRRHPLIAPCLDSAHGALCTPNTDAPWLSNPGALQEDPALERAVNVELAEVDRLAQQQTGVVLETALRRSRDAQSPLGRLVARALQASVPGIDVGLINGGGLRADLAAGPITFRSIYDVFPFESRVAYLDMTPEQLDALVNRIRGAGFGVPQVVGATVEEQGGCLRVETGRAPGEVLHVATVDFVARGGDGAPVLEGPVHALTSPRTGDRVRDLLWEFVKSHPAVVTELSVQQAREGAPTVAPAGR